jgi:hypothetical protein
MKNTFKVLGVISMALIIGFAMTACSDGGDDEPSFVAVTGITGVPTAATVGTELPLTGTVEPATATNKTITWTVTNGTGTATVSGSTLNPTGAGTVTVKAIIANGKAQGTDYAKEFTITVTGGSGGNTPTADDYTFGNLTQTAGSVTAVTITPRSGKSTGAVSNIRYAGSATIPQTAGTYAVTFDVVAVTGWNAASGLSAGNLIVNNQTPVADDYTIGNLTQTAGSVTEVIITAKSGKSTGAVGNIKYAGSAEIPQTAGTYTVTFDVAEVTGWNAASGLSAGTLRIYAEGVFVANTISEMATWLATQTTATPADAVTVVLNVSDLGGTSRRDGSVGKLLRDNNTKFVSLDLSGSTFTSFPSYTNAAIWEGAFSDCNSLTSVILPDRITSIGTYAFNGCTRLTSVTISNSVTSIGSGAFGDCTSLTSITIPNSVTSISSTAFRGCTSLASITIPDSVTSIGRYAFENTAWYNSKPNGLVYAGKVAYVWKGTMPANTTITLTDGTKGIADSAFDSCTRLTSVTIPDSVITIGGSAFSGCTGLTSIAIPNSVIGRLAFDRCTSLINVTIGSGVNNIEDYAFDECTSLISVTFATGSNIPDANFGKEVFPEGSDGDGGDTLKTAYSTGKAGTYTRAANGETWAKN